MFVEEFTKSRGARIGSYNATLETRNSVNGSTTTSVWSQSSFANDDTLPVAPAETGILGSTRVNTSNGMVAVKDLVAGQQILNSQGCKARVSFLIPAKKPTTALRIRAPYFGANQDFIIGKNHLLEIEADLAQYMFGETCILVPAWAFKDGSKVLFHELVKSDVMYQIQIEGADSFSVGGCLIAPLLTGPKTNTKRILTDTEARAFATERKIGQYN